MREWFHFHACIMSRSRGQSAVAAAAYRSGTKLYSRDDGLTKDFTDRREKDEIAHSEILAPEGAPEWVYDREELWNRAEAAEKRSDSQVAREVRFALARELTPSERITVCRDYIFEHFTSEGMIADLAIHHDKDNHNPHAHVLLTTRELVGNEFGRKARHWNNKDRLNDWREGCSRAQNRVLERKNLDVRADHRSYKDRGIDLEPGFHVGPKGWAVGERLLHESRKGRARNYAKPHRGDYGRGEQPRKPNPQLKLKLQKKRHSQQPKLLMPRGQTITSGVMWGGPKARNGKTRRYKEREGLRYSAQRQRKAERLKNARQVAKDKRNRQRFERTYVAPIAARANFVRYAAAKGMRAALYRLNREPGKFGRLQRKPLREMGRPAPTFPPHPNPGAFPNQANKERNRPRDRDRWRSRDFDR